MHNVPDDLLHEFTDPVGFTVERISDFIASRQCCGVSFLVNTLNEVICRSVQISNVVYLLSHVLELLFHTVVEGVFSVSI